MARRGKRNRKDRPRTRPKSSPQVLIEVSSGLYLDGYDGQTWETTPDRKKAWQMSMKEAAGRLERLIGQFPNATIFDV